MEGINLSSRQQTAAMEDITFRVTKLRTLADKLKEGLDIFKLQDPSERKAGKTIQEVPLSSFKKSLNVFRRRANKKSQNR